MSQGSKTRDQLFSRQNLQRNDETRIMMYRTMDILELSGLHTPPLHTHKGAPKVQLKRKT